MPLRSYKRVAPAVTSEMLPQLQGRAPRAEASEAFEAVATKGLKHLGRKPSNRNRLLCSAGLETGFDATMYRQTNLNDLSPLPLACCPTVLLQPVTRCRHAHWRQER